MNNVLYTIWTMAWRVAIYGMLGGALWAGGGAIIGEILVGQFDMGDIAPMLGGLGLIGGIFGLIIGAVVGIITGGIYAVINSTFLTDDTNPAKYRLYLTLFGGAVGFGAFSLFIFLIGSETDDAQVIWFIIAGMLIAAIGVAAATYAYVPRYMRRLNRMEEPTLKTKAS